MSFLSLLLIALLAGPTDRLAPGNQTRTVTTGTLRRTYLLHVPPGYDPKKPAPVVLALHGLAMNGPMMASFSGLSEKANRAGFLVAYPNGTGYGNLVPSWNAGGLSGRLAENLPDDVAFIRHLLDDLTAVANVDPDRVYATGISNGGMMCYRLACELSDRIAAIAPVAGTMAVDKCCPSWPVAVIHFHGTADTIVPFQGPNGAARRLVPYKSVEETIRAWVKLDGCPEKPIIVQEPDRVNDNTTVTRSTYGPGRGGVEVTLVTIDGGGHTWPGKTPPVAWLGKSTEHISANDLIWEFFEKHPRKPKN